MAYQPELTWQDSGTPAAQVVTNAELVAQSRIPDDAATAEDSLITAYLSAATKYVENQTRRALISRAVTIRAPYFPTHTGYQSLSSVAPVSAVASIQYYDTNDTLQTLASSAYVVDLFAEPVRIVLAEGNTWPTTRERPDAVIYNATAGYGAAASDVPDDLKHAIKMIAAHWYEHREAVGDSQVYDIPMAAESILQWYSRPEVM